MSGYVRIHRALIGHPAFRNDAEAMAFAWMIANAQWKATRVRYKGHGIQLQRGQLAISQRDMATAMDRDKGWIERLWKRLRNEAMVKVESKAGVAVVTICNYDEYQSDCEERKAEVKAPRKADAGQTQGTEQIREKDKKKIIEIPDWMPLDSWQAYKAMRAGMRNVPFSEAAQNLLISKIDGLRGEGHCPAKLLDEATLRGYRSVFGNENTKADTPKLDLSAADWEARAEGYEKIGMNDNAAECRRKAEAMRSAA